VSFCPLTSHKSCFFSSDIEDKYQKKLESIQNRGGPARPFEEKVSGLVGIFCEL
jgi:hypothetical protein